jgi:cytochrome o ubiquinol oxidase subunit 2
MPAVVVSIALLPLAGCGGVLDPRGPVGASERLILLDSIAIMLVIVVPLIVATLAAAWWFRASNERAAYRPDWVFSGTLELLIWAVPALVVTFLGGIAWFGSHALDPYRALRSSATPIEIEVVSLDWKWLFFYPTEGIAAVNQITIPVGRPVHFRLTSSGVMNSFFVPQLGSQIYTMAGMTTQLSLQADEAGSYAGLSAQFSGAGFAGMHFTVHAVPADAYATWIAATKAAGATLDQAEFQALARPSRDVPPSTYRAVEPGLFGSIAGRRGQADPAQGGESAGDDRPNSVKGH